MTAHKIPQIRTGGMGASRGQSSTLDPITTDALTKRITELEAKVLQMEFTMRCSKEKGYKTKL